MNSTCEYVWTPIGDEEREGQYKSYLTGQLVSFLPWLQNTPDGSDEENHVAIQISSKLYNDKHKSYRKEECVACQLFKTTEFALIGVCKETYFGEFVLKLLLLNFNNPYADIKYVLTNTDQGLEFRGAQSTIR